MKIFTTAQVRELDRIAIQEYGIPGFKLMQQAGQAAFSLIQQHYPETQTVDIYCGTGNNGGDGSVIGTLALKAGLKPRIIQLGDSAKIHDDAATARQAYLQAGGKVFAFADMAPGQPDLIVDAIFGTGLDRPPGGEYAHAIKQINASYIHVLAIDIPSGLNSDTGMPLGATVCAQHTITFIAMKQGLLTGQARDHTGELVLDTLQLPQNVLNSIDSNQYTLETDSLIPAFPPRQHSSHKGDFGHVLLIGGAPGFSGAIRLSAEAALRSGTGLVTIATHPSHRAFINTSRPEIMTVATDDVERLSNAIEHCTIVGIGPGLGTDAWSRSLLDMALNSEKPLVVDADALNLLCAIPVQRSNWILTPHPGEAARLLGVSNSTIQSNRYQAATSLQQRYGGVVVLKGSGSIVQTSSTTAVCTAGNPGMASGGMGDALTGITCAMVAQKMALKQAAETAVLLHAHAADLAAKAGERGMIVSDLFPYIRQLCNP